MDNKAHLWRAWWKEQVEPKIPVLHSLQMRLALGYSALIAALLILMNTYPLLMSQNLMFRSQQTALANQAVVITNALTTADQLTPAGVEQSLSQVEDLNVQRILITDGAGLVLYDSQENGVAGKYALTGRSLPPCGERRLFQRLSGRPLFQPGGLAGDEPEPGRRGRLPL